MNGENGILKKSVPYRNNVCAMRNIAEEETIWRLEEI